MNTVCTVERPGSKAERWQASQAAIAAEPVWLSPGLSQSPVMDRLCSRFALSLLTHPAAWGASFNLRRDLNHLMAIVGRHLVWPADVLASLRDFLSRRARDNLAWEGHEALSPPDFLARHGHWRGHYEDASLFYYLDEFAKDHARPMMRVLATTRAWLDRQLQDQPSALERNVGLLGELLGLSRAERALLLLGTLARYQRELRAALVECKVGNASEAHAVLAELADVPAQDVADALRVGSRLERIGLVDGLLPDHHVTDLADLMKVGDKLPGVLMRDYRDAGELMAVFTRPAPLTALSAQDFAYVGEDVSMLVALLRGASEGRVEGVNVLLYGPPGTGKTELARVLAQTAGLQLYEVESADREGHSLSGRERYRSMQISQIFLKSSPDVALLFDEVEDVFPAMGLEALALAGRAAAASRAGGAEVACASVGGKAWVNHVLEHNPVPTIWITNNIHQIDPAFRRRFQFHLELTSPPPGAREALVAKALAGVSVGAAFIARLTARPGLTPAQVHTAVRFAQLAARALPDDACMEALIERQLRQADAALGTRESQPARPVATRYALDLLHVESRHELPRIIEALRRRGHGTLCFHGPPGTGKTALAEHMAQALERPLMVCRASDVMSKYVGETEQNMARMFAQAESEGAVLLLDEADTFLQRREMAERHYEVSEVNEMLQGMERFRGIFVCTTNLFDQLDAAALRRFTFKLQFHPLTVAQRERMFVAEALGGQGEPTPAQRLALAQMEHLTPGDYAAVKRQFDILGEATDPDAFLAQLQAEHRLKPQVRQARSIGFTAA